MIIRCAWCIALALGTVVGAWSNAGQADEGEVPEILVTARRLVPAANERIFSTTVIDRAALERSGGAQLDDVLRDIPGFSLFRRQASLASHPTTHGVTLRGLGPNGAGRTLVLLDGIPQNDPFGGWINWSRLSPTTLENVAVTRGGGAGPWGNSALAGTIRLQSRVTDGAGARAEAAIDTYGAARGGFGIHGDVERGHVSLAAAGHVGKGPYLIREDQRGPIDRRSENRGGVIRAAFSIPIDDATSATLSASTSSNTYINGIDILKVKSRVSDAALSVVHQADPDAVSWEAHVYGRGGKLSSIFAAVDDTRTTATPALDQYNVPSTAVGGSGLVRIPLSPTFTVDVGGDVRHVEGETNERYFFSGGSFVKMRTAGGAQTILGGFTELTWAPRPTMTFTAAARVDHWRQMDGLRREASIATGVPSREDRYPSRGGTDSNFRLGASIDVAPPLTLRAVAYTGFRVPTLNELYRPFRVGSDITEANPTLVPETYEGLEAGVTWRAADTFTANATFFLGRLKNAVGNVTIATTPGFNAELGVFVPAAGTLRQRRNIDRITSEGVELEALWAITPNFDVVARYLFTNPKVDRNASDPSLEGLRLPQVARHQAVVQVGWTPREGTLLQLGMEASSGQYDDDQNTRRLSGYVIADFYAEHALNDRLVIFVSGENLFDRTIEAGRSAGGLVSLGLARRFATGLRWKM